MVNKKFMSVLVILCCFVFFAGIASAAPDSDDDLYSKHSTAHKIFYKAGRGFTNIFTGWVEIPKKISRTCSIICLNHTRVRDKFN